MNRTTIVPGLIIAMVATSTWIAPTTARGAQKTPLIPRTVLFGNPDKASLRLSPDGKYIGYLAPVNGVLNVWVGPASDLSKAKPVTHDTHRGVRIYFWAFTSRHVLFLQDKGGDENWRIYSVNLDNDKTTDLTPFDKVQARVQQVSPDYPDEILVALNNRDPKLHDLYRVNITTGKMSLVETNTDGFVGYLTDNDMKAHLAMKSTRSGGMELYKRAGDHSWTLFTSIPAGDALTTNPISLDELGKNLYMIDSRNRNTAALSLVSLENGEGKTLAEDSKADIAGVMGHPTRNIVMAAQSTYERRRWHILDKSIEPDFKKLETIADGEFNVISRTKDDRQWLVAYVMDDGPVRYYHYDRNTKQAKFLCTNRQQLEGIKLAQMHPVTIKARDGLTLVSYYTLPVWSDPDGNGKPDKPLPMVLFVHGGPWGRDNWGYNSYHQWLANRGYAVLSVNYRGSTGFGKDFINAANHEWAGKMHDDLIDAVNWAVEQKIADKNEVAIMGGSYGGYATLVGLTFTPDEFACGVDIVGPSNLVTLLQTIPPYWAPMIEMFTTRVGDFRTEEGRKLLEERSPLNYVDRIKKPLLIGQGKNDPRVNEAEADQIVAAMQAKHIPVTYVLFPDEGHGFHRPENNMSFNAVAEVFLAQNLGGRYEPISEDVTGSTMQVPVGADDIPGLPKVLKELNKKQDNKGT